MTRLSDEPIKYKAFFYLIAYSGFRRSEMLGLEWKDIDFEHNIIRVRRTSNYTAERGTYTDTTKTKRSQRTLKIADSIMDMLKELKAEQDEQALNCGDKWVETDRLFTKWNGEPMNNSNSLRTIPAKPIGVKQVEQYHLIAVLLSFLYQIFEFIITLQNY